MIALDTNVLLRLLLEEDAAQAAKARRELEKFDDSDGEVFINDIVLAETLWTLRAAYDCEKPDLLLTLHSLLNTATFSFENRTVLQAAVTMYESSAADFSDCLIAAKNSAAGYEYTRSFDRAMRGLTGVKLL